MRNDPRKLRPIELCRLLNSTPLGEVINEQQLRNHRTRAGMRIGDAKHVDLVRYVAWLMQQRHARKPKPDVALAVIDSFAAAEGAAAIASEKQLQSHGQKLTSKQEALIAALLTEPNYTAAAIKAGVSPATVYRWLQLPSFRLACRQARRELVESAVGRMQAAAGQAIETLLHVSRQGRRDGDRVLRLGGVARSRIPRPARSGCAPRRWRGDGRSAAGHSRRREARGQPLGAARQFRTIDRRQIPPDRHAGGRAAAGHWRRCSGQTPGSVACRADRQKGKAAMNLKRVTRLYDRLTVWERIPLLVASYGRGDETEAKLLANASPVRVWQFSEHWLAEQALHVLTLMYIGEQLEAAANYFFAVWRLADTEDLYPGDWWRAAQANAYFFTANCDAWQRFCGELGIVAAELTAANHRGWFLPYCEEHMAANCAHGRRTAGDAANGRSRSEACDHGGRTVGKLAKLAAQDDQPCLTVH